MVVADGIFLSIAAFLRNKASYFQIFLSSHYILESTESSGSACILASVQQKTLQDAVWVHQRSRVRNVLPSERLLAVIILYVSIVEMFKQTEMFIKGKAVF